MTVGSFKSYYTGWCDVCKAEWPENAFIYFVPGKRGYFCSEKCACQMYPEAAIQPAEAPTSEGPRASSESDAAKGHRENMESARLTRDVLSLLVVAVDSLEKELSTLITVMREGKR